jgi:hypothetical protein
VDLLRARMCEQPIHQPLRHSAWTPAKVAGDEHFSQCRQTAAEIEQCHGPYDLISAQGNPEVSAAALVDTRDVEEVGLILGSNRYSELIALNGQNESPYLLVQPGSKWDHVDVLIVH